MDWIEALTEEEGDLAEGHFANQNTVVRLPDTFTVERLTQKRSPS